MGNIRRTYSPEFKLRAVKMYLEERKSWIACRARARNKDIELCKQIRFEYERLKGIYGYRRMQILLRRKYGVYINHKRMYRLMRNMNLQAVIRRKKPYVVYSNQDHEQVPNVINRDFEARQPNRKWATDITYLTVNGQRVYLSVM